MASLAGETGGADHVTEGDVEATAESDNIHVDILRKSDLESVTASSKN